MVCRISNMSVQSSIRFSSNQDDSDFVFEQYKDEKESYKHLSLTPINKNDLPMLINEYYSIDEIVAFIKGHPECKRITLQFPDELICDSTAVSSAISEKLRASNRYQTRNDGDDGNEQSIWILADTSYSPCCVDEVAAQHINGDLVIHFGDSCLNPVDKVKVAYVFGKPVIDKRQLVDQFRANFNKSDKIIIMADSPHSYIISELVKTLAEYESLGYGDILSDSFPEAVIIGYNPQQSQPCLKSLNRCFYNVEARTEQDLQGYKLFHIGIPKPPRLLKLTTLFEAVTLYDPLNDQVQTGPYPNLMRRYRNMMSAKSGGTIGLLVNTLSISNTRVLLNSLKEKIQNAGKKHYMFVVGKPNVAKLANFDTIDVWCILGCDHQGIILDQNNEYFKPIITPFELLLALEDDVSWSGKWETDFNKLIEQLQHHPLQETNDTDDTPQFDVITGKFASNSKPLRSREYVSIETGAEDVIETGLVQKLSQDMVIKNTISTAAINLQQKHWKGLGTDYDQQEIDVQGSLVEDGRNGIARGYDYDVNSEN